MRTVWFQPPGTHETRAHFLLRITQSVEPAEEEWRGLAAYPCGTGGDTD